MAKKGRLPITGGDIFTLAFLSLFLIVGFSVLAATVRNGAFDAFIAIWCAMFIGIPLLVGCSMFKRFFDLARSSRRGRRIQAKVVGSTADDGFRINGRSVIDLDVRFFDERGNVVEKTLDLNATNMRGFPVGSTVDIVECDGEYTVASTGYDEAIVGEDALMSGGNTRQDAPYQAAAHIVTCPYCGGQVAIDDRWRPSKKEEA